MGIKIIAKKDCIVCGQSFDRPPGQSTTWWNKRILCNVKCRAVWLKEKKIGFQPGHPNFSTWRFPKGNKPWNKGKSVQTNNALSRWREAGGVSWNTGRKVSEEEHQRLIEIRKFQKSPSGSKHHWWKGGKTKLRNKIKTSRKYREWRNRIFRRDEFTCQNCRKKGGCLHAHHDIPMSIIIEKYSLKTISEAKECEVLWDTTNGRTLCRLCHHQTDTYGSKMLKMKEKLLTNELVASPDSRDEVVAGHDAHKKLCPITKRIQVLEEC